MEATYPGMVIEAEKGYDFAIGFDIDAVAAEDREALLFKVGIVSRLHSLTNCYKGYQSEKCERVVENVQESPRLPFSLVSLLSCLFVSSYLMAIKVSSMRRHLLGAPIIKALQGVKTGTGGSLPFMGLETRPTEALFVKPGNDRCTIVFALNFPDETDNAIARVMLQQFAKESSKVSLGRATLSCWFTHIYYFFLCLCPSLS
jgi:hypothetical protein